MAAQDPDASTENNGMPLAITASLFLALTWTSVFLRTYVRAFMLKGFLVDDWFMLIAQVRHLTKPILIITNTHKCDGGVIPTNGKGAGIRTAAD